MIKEFINLYKHEIINRCFIISEDYICNKKNLKHFLIKLLKSKNFRKYIKERNYNIENIN